MVYRPRLDEPGAWHHAMNRGIARRPVFERKRDVRCFLAHLARAVRRGEIEVHAYSILTTHFHLLVRSPRGMLSEATMRIEQGYARYYNRSRRRDGPLFRGRFYSRRVTSSVHRLRVVRYIDNNPMQARLVRRASDYPHGSAWHYSREKGPPWLERSVVEQAVCDLTEKSTYDPRDYERVIGKNTDEDDWVVERRLTRPARSADPLDDLLDAAPPSVMKWMMRKTALADGTRLSECFLAPKTVQQAIAQRSHADPGWVVRPHRRWISGWRILEAGLLITVSGLTHAEVQQRTGIASRSAYRYVRIHQQFLKNDHKYRQRVSEVLLIAKQTAGR